MSKYNAEPRVTVSAALELSHYLKLRDYCEFTEQTISAFICRLIEDKFAEKELAAKLAELLEEYYDNTSC